jgi:dihydroflavonol-4-reductase
MQVFLTGATGFIGQALVRNMRSRGWQIHALVRDPSSQASRWLVEQGCSLVRGDVTQPQGLAEAMTGADVVFHNAGVYEFGVDSHAAARMQQVNAHGTDCVLGAALQARVPRAVYVSTVWALGGSGPADKPAAIRIEGSHHAGPYLTAYERSKSDAHQIALKWRDRGLPLVIGMPNGVVGANDHSVFGYFLRLYLLHGMPPVGWGGDTVYALVYVNSLAEGLCLAVEKAPAGQDYLFCGEPVTMRRIYELWGRYPGGMVPRFWVPRWLVRPWLALLEPLQRWMHLPAFLGRDSVDATRVHLNYSSSKAQRDLGWHHPSAQAMWAAIVPSEQALMKKRKGWLNKLRHQAVVEAPEDLPSTPSG